MRNFLPLLLMSILLIAGFREVLKWTPNETYIPTVEAAAYSLDPSIEELINSSSPVNEKYEAPKDVTKFGPYTLYEVCMYKMIAIEGIVLDDYYCAAGYRTFGIGCVADTPEEKKLIASGLTYHKVREHLEKEWTKMIDLVERDAPKQYKKHEKAALAMLFLSIGYERFWAKNKKHRHGYENGLGIPRSTWLKQCNYKSSSTGKYVRSEHIYSSKRFEVDLFFNNKMEVVKQAEKFRKSAILHQKRLKVWSNLSEAVYTPLRRWLA